MAINAKFAQAREKPSAATFIKPSVPNRTITTASTKLNTDKTISHTIARNINHEIINTDHDRISLSIIQKAFKSGEAQFIEDVNDNDDFGMQESVLWLKLMGMICLPIFSIGGSKEKLKIGFEENNRQILGAIYLDSQTTINWSQPPITKSLKKLATDNPSR